MSSRRAGVDLLKCICAFMIICLHRPMPGVVGEVVFTLSRCAVPVFFMITGFFYNDIVKREQEVRQIKKIFILMLGANLLYLFGNVVLSEVMQTNISYLNQFTNIFSVIEIFLAEGSLFSAHLWYLRAIFLVLTFIYLFIY